LRAETDHWATREELDTRSHLIKLLQEPWIGLDTTAIVAEAIYVDAKFNLWFLSDVKGRADLEAIMEILDTTEPIVKRTSAAVERYRKNRDTIRLHDSVREFIEIHLRIMSIAN